MDPKRLILQLRTFERILREYEANRKEPLARFLTAFFKANKQMGSNDRRRASRWIYNYYRLGNAMLGQSWEERLVAAEYLCESESEVVTYFAPSWLSLDVLTFEEKLANLKRHTKFQLEDVFPLVVGLSEGIDHIGFLHSLFVQPDLFIRVNPKEQTKILNILAQEQLSYQRKEPHGIALANGVKLDRLSALKGKYIVQDLSSQRTGKYFEAHPGEQWWDACAASGGKSLLLWQSYPEVQLLVSDIRSSILRNLDERFDEAGLKHYRRKIIDLTKDPQAILGNEKFDGIILDAPCSGSGTWGRAPEMMQRFGPAQLHYFIGLQQQIALNVIKHLKKDCPLIYITCSVYADENEKQIAFLEKQGMRLEKMEVLKGYTEKADTMFVARLIKE